MAPRKSNVSIVSNGPGDETTATEAAPTPNKAPAKDGVGIDDLTLPKSMIARLAKGVLPPNTQIQKDALLALHKSATVFVSYIANGANELTQANQKKTIMPQDVITAVKDAEFESFLPRLQAELKKYNDIQSDKRNSYRNRVKQEKAAASASEVKNEAATQDVSMDLDDTVATAATNGNDDDADRPTKKLKGAEGVVLPVNGDDPSILVAGGEDASPDEDDAEQDDEDGSESESDDDDEDDDEAEPESADEQADPPDTLRDPNGFRDEALDEPDSD